MAIVGQLIENTIPSLKTYENKTFTTEDGSNATIEEISFLKKRAVTPVRTVTVKLDTVLINGRTLRNVIVVTEFGTEAETRHYLSQIEKGIVSSADIVHVYANTTVNPEQAIQELINDNSDLGMIVEG